jgi:hypothetical protein
MGQPSSLVLATMSSQYMNLWNPYLARVDLLAGEGIIVGTHIDCCVGIRRLCCLLIRILPIRSWAGVVVVDLVTLNEKSRISCGIS